MRYIVAFALLALLTAHARADTFTVENRCPQFTVVNKTDTRVIKVVSRNPLKTTCGCAAGVGNPIVECSCFVGECQCAACGLGGAAKQPGKSPSTPTIPAPSAGTRAQPGRELGSSEDTPQPGTYTLVPGAGQAGSISGGCANGQCASPSNVQRGGFFRRR